MLVMVRFSGPKPKFWWYHIKWFGASYLLPSYKFTSFLGTNLLYIGQKP